jgi:hypothetical protein
MAFGRLRGSGADNKEKESLRGEKKERKKIKKRKK